MRIYLKRTAGETTARLLSDTTEEANSLAESFLLFNNSKAPTTALTLADKVIAQELKIDELTKQLKVLQCYHPQIATHIASNYNLPVERIPCIKHIKNTLKVSLQEASELLKTAMLCRQYLPEKDES